MYVKVRRQLETGKGESKEHDLLIKEILESRLFNYIGKSRIDGQPMFEIDMLSYQRSIKINKIINKNFVPYLNELMKKIGTDCDIVPITVSDDPFKFY